MVLAAAGLRRLGLDHAIGELLPLDQFPPSPGQGALGIQVRTDEPSAPLREILSTVGDVAVDAEVRAERALLAELHGGCSVPVGAYGETLPDGELTLFGQVSSLDGNEQISGTLTGPSAEPESSVRPWPRRSSARARIRSSTPYGTLSRLGEVPGDVERQQDRDRGGDPEPEEDGEIAVEGPPRPPRAPRAPGAAASLAPRVRVGSAWTRAPRIQRLRGLPRVRSADPTRGRPPYRATPADRRPRP
ncbi:hypothetical protein NKH77_17595 [Streptomyces sp. M19]